jgi:SAM-dependent methyltransferase
MAQLGKQFGDVFAEVYDEYFHVGDDSELTASVLADLAGTGDILEFGLGTGRVAIPLVNKGLKVVGIENSQAMIDKFKQKSDDSGVEVMLGDFATAKAVGNFSVVFISYGTVYLLDSQEEQIQCFENAARHLSSGGVFVLDGFVHDRTQWRNNQEVTTRKLSDNFARLRLGVHNAKDQTIDMQYMDFTPEGVKFFPTKLRYIWPSEMDLMARLAGFKLRSRWTNWKQEPFTADSSSQVVVYEKL